MAANTVVRARIDGHIKEDAAIVLKAMGLTVSDAFRIMLTRIAHERCLPFDIKVPNATTQKAIAELEADSGRKLTSVGDLMADLHADN